MGVGPIALKVYNVLACKSLLRRGMTVLELGSQEMFPSTTGRADIASLFAALGGGGWECRKTSTARDMMLALGMEYTSIDLDGKRGALPYDLNEPLPPLGQFDLVTNHGTSEHCFDQAQCFRTVHETCKRGGLMVHCVPMRGYRGHCFYLYQPELFEELADANGYETIGLWASLDEYGLEPELVPVQLREIHDWSGPAPKGNMLLSAVLRKKNDAAFRAAMQWKKIQG